ncbi:MAG: DMT family transporter [Bdellovibrionales bacterium]|nr:DMT family transporter [Bdellovibrionales bacterium]
MSRRFSNRNLGLIAVNFVAIIFGAIGLIGMLKVSALWIVFYRAFFSALTLFFYSRWTQCGWVPLRKITEKWKLVGSGLFLGIHWVSFFIAVKSSGIAIATLTFSVFPLFTILTLAFLSRKMLNPLELVCGLIIVLAVQLLFQGRIGHGDLPSYGLSFYGPFMGLTSALTFSWFGLLSRDLNRTQSSLVTAIYQNLLVLLFVLPFLSGSVPSPKRFTDFAILMMLGVIMTALTHQLYFFALKHLPPSVCGGFIAMEPVYAILFAFLFFHEPLTAKVFLSGGLIMGASFLLLHSETPMG